MGVHLKINWDWSRPGSEAPDGGYAIQSGNNYLNIPFMDGFEGKAYPRYFHCIICVQFQFNQISTPIGKFNCILVSVFNTCWKNQQCHFFNK